MPEIKLGALKITYFENESSLKRFISQIIKNNQPTQITTLNSLMYLSAYRDSEIREIMKKSLLVPDSFGVVLAIYFFCGKLIKRLSGIDLMLKMLEIADKDNYKVYLLGSKADVIKTAVKNIKKRFQNLKLVGWHDGFSFTENIIDEINSKEPDMLFVGLGMSKQEKWIDRNLEKLNVKIAMGVGGAFDVISQKLRRAPPIFCAIGLEWLFRLLQEPWRIKRIINLPLFVLRILTKRL